MSGPPRPENQDGDRVTDARVGSILADRYRIHALLGEGGMGKVYAGEHVLMRKKLAVKVLHRELTTIPDVVQRFEREAMAAANIDHPNVAAATDFGKLDDGSVYLVLEYVQGRSLREEIAEGPIPAERALHVGRQIASALGSAHGLKRVHRDLKPENVMLVDKGGEPDFVKVLDFGIAKVPIGELSKSQRPPGTGTPITKVGMVFGTPEYMAPEQALGQTVDGRADLYALGVILYEMIAGVRPFSSSSQVGILGQQLSKPPPPFSERAPGIAVPRAAEQLVLKLLAAEAADRFQTAADVSAAIDAIIGPPITRRGFQRSETSLQDLAGLRHALAPSPVVVDDRAHGSDRRSAPDTGDAAALKIEVPLTEGVDPPLPSFSEAGLFGASSAGAAAGSAAASGSGSSAAGGAGKRLGGALSSAGAANLWDGVLTYGGAALSHAERTVDRLRRGLPERLQPPLAGVSSRALLFGLGGGVLLLIVVAGSLLIGSSDPPVAPDRRAEGPAAEPAPSEPAEPTSGKEAAEAAAEPATLAEAKQLGLEALERFAKARPNEAAVQLALAEAELQGKQHARAVKNVERVIGLEPMRIHDPDVSNLLMAAAQVPASSDAAFELLESKMKAKGADVIYELAVTKGVPPNVRRRAEAWLKTPAFQKNSSPELNVAVALRHATECRQRHALLKRAKNVGDRRSLSYLKSYQSKTGCGASKKADCHACMRGDDLLTQAITAVQQRDRD
ncbi:MAG TPA: serine/threonine-protein kinase [Polyangiaceae bacterium]|nr:serine/threonine-protein kinase [Polyangiaceae bacterium]